jgi:hypothetical protein
MKETVYEVVPSGKQWLLQMRGGTSKELFETRDEAIATGRILCEKARPSRLRVRKIGAGPPR